jgi:hypothetical protein
MFYEWKEFIEGNPIMYSSEAVLMAKTNSIEYRKRDALRLIPHNENEEDSKK